jgi:Do/DeqQ family serine protease
MIYRRRNQILLFVASLMVLIIAIVAAIITINYLVRPNQVIQQAKNEKLTVQPGLIINPTGKIFLTENTIADIAQRVSDSVVNIDISSNVVLSDSSFAPSIPFGNFDFFFGQGLGNRMPHWHGQHQLQKGAGSGLIYRADGYILTNNHVVGQADDIQVTLNDKRVFKGTVVGRDSFTDLAIVKIDARDLPVAQLGSSKNIRPGEWVIAIGNPMGLDHTVTFGIISALGRSLRDLNNNVELIQTDAAINPGNSGGPLLNIRGEVIGINTAIRGDAQNIGFAIPIDTAREITDQLLSKGSIERPYLGIYMQDMDENLARSLGVSSETKGVVIAGLAGNSPAEKSGLEQGDIIQKVEGKPVITSRAVQGIIRSHKPGESLTIIIFRDGAIRSISVRIGNYPTNENSRK